MMKTLASSAAMALAFGTAASAMDFGNGWAWDSTVEAIYDVENQDMSIGFDTELSYTLDNGIKMYASTYVDLRNPDFDGMNVGLEYNFDQPDVTLGAWVALDADFQYENAFVGVSWSF